MTKKTEPCAHPGCSDPRKIVDAIYGNLTTVLVREMTCPSCGEKVQRREEHSRRERHGAAPALAKSSTWIRKQMQWLGEVWGIAPVPDDDKTPNAG